MSKLLIVIADEDEQYLSPLEMKFIEEAGDIADIITITEKGYFEEYFSVPRKIDVLVINKSFNSTALLKHDIDNLFILNEESAECGENEVYKYTSVKDIYDSIMSNVKIDAKLTQEKKQTQMIMVYSPIGGAGTSTIALAIANAIGEKNKSVLYMNLENIQSLSTYIGSEKYMSGALEKAISGKTFDIAEKIRQETMRINNVNYVPPMQQAAAVLGIKDEHYIHLLEKIKKENIYDYIVIDTTPELSSEKCGMMGMAEKVVIVVMQNIIAAKKLDIFLENIDCSNSNKFLFLCNKFIFGNDDNLTNSTMKNNCIIKQYVEHYEVATLRDFIKSDSIQSFIYGIM